MSVGRRAVFGASLGAVLALASGAASAQEATPSLADETEPPPRLPLPYAQRPLTLPRLVLNPLADVYAAKSDATFLDVTVGAAFGITDNFEVEAVVAPLQLAPTSATYGRPDQPGPSLGLTYRWCAGPTEAAVHLDGTLITLPAASGAVLRPGIPFRAHAGERVRIDFGAYLVVTVSKTTTTGIALPFAIAVDVTKPFHLGFNSGFTVPTVDHPTPALPFGAFAGYAIGRKNGPILDINPFFRWPSIAGNDAQGQSSIDEFEVGAELAGFFYL